VKKPRLRRGFPKKSSRYRELPPGAAALAAETALRTVTPTETRTRTDLMLKGNPVFGGALFDLFLHPPAKFLPFGRSVRLQHLRAMGLPFVVVHQVTTPYRFAGENGKRQPADHSRDDYQALR
jgi:hypothetical protein